MAKTHRNALELTETGTISGLYLPNANTTDPSTNGQITYVSGEGFKVYNGAVYPLIAGAYALSAVLLDTSTATATIPDGVGIVNVTSGSGSHIVVLPTATVGTIIYLAGGTAGYELRAASPTVTGINGGTAAYAESRVEGNGFVRCVCISTTISTNWICSRFGQTGTEAAVEAAAA